LGYNLDVNGTFSLPFELAWTKLLKYRESLMNKTGIATSVHKLKNGLIVSCQASEFSPLNRPSLIAALALVAEQQGAVGVRVDGASNIRAVRKVTGLPIIGIEKRRLPECSVYITPTFAAVRRVAQAGADIIALDCTNRRRPQGELLREIVERAKLELKVPLMADVATLDEGIVAADLGVDIVATTLHGYTESTPNHRGPAFRLLRGLARRTQLPVVLEGRVHRPKELRHAFDLGAYAVVVGTAITNPEWLTRRFVEVTPGARHRTPAAELE
jgi:putative N-acetylmannosamine-6-phosphate epimerase